jgi:hypothetical protein
MTDGQERLTSQGGEIGRRLNKICDSKIAAPIEVQFHKVVVAYLDQIM